tara:strand:+ start:3583 stop:3708 length:126 start_codon:yes stop_codon:yes gene_type:complete
MITGIRPMRVTAIAIKEKNKEVLNTIKVIMKAVTEKATPTP